jgi:hypothetical protein
MKKLLGCFFCVMLLFCLSTPAIAVPVDAHIGTSNAGNPSGETAWLWSLPSVTDSPIDCSQSSFPGLFTEGGCDPGIGGWNMLL